MTVDGDHGVEAGSEQKPPAPHRGPVGRLVAWVPTLAPADPAVVFDFDEASFGGGASRHVARVAMTIVRSAAR